MVIVAYRRGDDSQLKAEEQIDISEYSVYSSLRRHWHETPEEKRNRWARSTNGMLWVPYSFTSTILLLLDDQRLDLCSPTFFMREIAGRYLVIQWVYGSHPLPPQGARDGWFFCDLQGSSATGFQRETRYALTNSSRITQEGDVTITYGAFGDLYFPAFSRFWPFPLRDVGSEEERLEQIGVGLLNWILMPSDENPFTALLRSSGLAKIQAKRLLARLRIVQTAFQHNLLWDMGSNFK